MAGVLFPHERMQLGVPRQAGRPAVSLAGLLRTIFTDPDHTVPAIITDVQGNPLPAGQVEVDDLSRLPFFLAPDGTEQLYDDAGNVLFPAAGPAGPKGDTGPTGAPGLPGNAVALSHTQYFAIPATSWTVDHSLGFIPSGIVVTPNGGQPTRDFEIVSNSSTITIVRFDFPVAGYIDLS